MSVPGKGLGGGGGLGGQVNFAGGGMAMGGMPSGLMFVTALLVARGRSRTSNVGDTGQDIITMTDEAACLPLYLIQTRMDMGNTMGMGMGAWRGMMAGMAGGGAPFGGGAPPAVDPFSGSGNRLGGN